jgi:hypothetical protein
VADNLTGTITAGTITGGSIGGSSGTMCDASLERLTINRMLSSGTNISEQFGQQILRMNADDQSLAIAARRKFELDISNQSSALDILQQRATGAQPQSGGGPGQPVSFPIQQPGYSATPPPRVIAVSSTGAITSV